MKLQTIATRTLKEKYQQSCEAKPKELDIFQRLIRVRMMGTNRNAKASKVVSRPRRREAARESTALQHGNPIKDSGIMETVSTCFHHPNYGFSNEGSRILGPISFFRREFAAGIKLDQDSQRPSPSAFSLIIDSDRRFRGSTSVYHVKRQN